MGSSIARSTSIFEIDADILHRARLRCVSQYLSGKITRAECHTVMLALGIDRSARESRINTHIANYATSGWNR